MNNTLFKANMYKYFITLFRVYPKSFFVSGLLSIFYTMLYAYLMAIYLFDGTVSEGFTKLTGTSDYLSYVAVGAIVYGFTVSSLLNVSRSLITERRMGTLESLMMAPYHRGVYFFSQMLAQTIHNVGEKIFAIPILFLFGVRFMPNAPFATIVILLLSMLALLGLSMLLANVMLYTQDTYISQNTLFAFMFMVCGVAYPIEYLPQWVQNIAYCIPLTHSLPLLRDVLVGKFEWSSGAEHLIALAVFGTIYLVVGMVIMGRVEQIALEKMEG